MYSIFNLSKSTAAGETNVHEKLQEIYANVSQQENYESSLLKEDVVNLYKYIRELHQELAFVKLENIVLEDFLKKNNPTELQNVKRALENFKIPKKIRFAPMVESKGTQKIQTSVSNMNESGYSGKSNNRFRSQQTTFDKNLSATSIFSNRNISYSDTISSNLLNYTIRTELADKLSQEHENICEQIANDGKRQLKNLYATIMELQLRNSELTETLQSFEDLVVKSETGALIQKLPSERFFKYTDNWIKNGLALVSRMRLKLVSIGEKCHTQKISFVRKLDLVGVLRPVDFEILKINRNIYTSELKIKKRGLRSLKKVSGEVAIAVAEEKKSLQKLDNRLKEIKGEIMIIKQSIEHLDEEAKYVERELIAKNEEFENLKYRVGSFIAPNIKDYIKKKDDLHILKKEEKTLNRNLNILQITLKTAKMKLAKKRRNIALPK